MASNDQNARTPSTLTHDPEWTMGDFTIVSSDMVVFKVDKYYLYGAR